MRRSRKAATARSSSASRTSSMEMAAGGKRKSTRRLPRFLSAWMAFRRSEPIFRRRRSSSELPSHSDISMSSAWLTAITDWHGSALSQEKDAIFRNQERENLLPPYQTSSPSNLGSAQLRRRAPMATLQSPLSAGEILGMISALQQPYKKKEGAFGSASRSEPCATDLSRKKRSRGPNLAAKKRLQFPGPEEEPALVTTKSSDAINSTQRNSMYQRAPHLFRPRNSERIKTKDQA